jgi:[1-hydroxy-2-(trimethylamino)ethyl]phosphonate dioxygenase
MNFDQIIDGIFQLYRERGNRLYGEAVTETEHALQCATFARRAGESPEIIAGCLIHDFGHLCHDLGEDIADRGIDAAHEDLGADRLAEWFPAEVVEPIRLHVQAKRYLCWKEPLYYSELSEASRQSLVLQGGPMDETEGRAFEKHPHFEAAICLRRYDDMGKVAGMKIDSFEDFRSTLRNVAFSRV